VTQHQQIVLGDKTRILQRLVVVIVNSHTVIWLRNCNLL